MTKNRGKAGKNRKKNAKNIKDGQEEYAQVDRVLGKGRFVVRFNDGDKGRCIIPANMRRKACIVAGDIILIEFRNGKAEIIHKYMPDKVCHLKACNKLPGFLK